MSALKILKRLMQDLEVFENSGEVLRYDAFVQWLQQRKQGGKRDLRAETAAYMATMPDVRIGSLVAVMNKYARIYTKKALENTPLQSVEEFTYLASLAEHGRMTKTELIQLHLQEKTTGAEMLKRLVQQGFIQEAPHDTDKRRHYVSITPQGYAVFGQTISTMQKVSLIVTADLSDAEKQQLIQLLEKLDHFHKNVLQHEKNLDLDKVIEKYK